MFTFCACLILQTNYDVISKFDSDIKNNGSLNSVMIFIFQAL
jgi:hypothetical protein